VISLELLKTFLDAAAHESFRRAALARFVTISAVSQQMKLLESQLGVALFDRLGRRVKLTSEGRSLAAALRPAFAQIEDAIAQLDLDQGAVSGLLRIGTARAFGEYWVRPRLLALFETHPQLRMQMCFDVPSVLEERLAEGRLDAVLLVRPAQLSTTETLAVAKETFVAVAAPSLLRRTGTPRDEAAFRALPFAIFDPDLAMHAPWWRAHFGESAPTPDHVVAEAPSLDELLAWTTAGRCACVLPSYWVEREVRKEALVVLEPSIRGRPRQRSGQTVTNTIYLAWRHGTVSSARVRALRDALTR